MASAVTIFTPPKSCSTPYVDIYRYFSIGIQCSDGRMVPDTACSPSTLSACPFNWKAVATADSKTTCCPGEFDLTSQSPYCFSTAGALVLNGIICESNVAKTSTAITYTFTPGVWARGVSFVGAATSPGVTQTVASSTTSSISSKASATTTTTTSASLDPPSKPSLSGGAIAGIVIGSVIAVALIVNAILLLRKRRGKHEAAAEHQSFLYPPGTHDNIKPGPNAMASDHPAYIDARDMSGPHLLPLRADPVELENRNAAPHTYYGS